MSRVTKSARRVAVLYPRGQKTGGPEAVHQFVDELRRQDVEAFVCPHPDTVARERVTAFDHYDAPELPWNDLRSDDVLVGAEIYAKELLAAPTAQRVIWWLSVDNASPFLYTRMILDRRRRRAALVEGPVKLAYRLIREAVWRRRLLADPAVHHVAQSRYAKTFVERWSGRPTPLVSDYVVPVVGVPRPDRSSRRVAFNPAKGGDLVQRVSRTLPDFEFVPLSGLEPDELARELRRTGIYLDLGHHPGKDRIPREASLAGCAVVVARRGSAKRSDDLPIASHYKIPAGRTLVADCRRTLLSTSGRLSEVVAEQEPFRAAIRSERSTFAREVAEFRTRFVAAP